MPSPCKDTHLQHYVSAALEYRSTLKALYVGDRVNCIQPYPLVMDAYNRLRPRLHEFPNLTELEVKVHTDKSVFELEYIVDNCPSLQTLRFSAYRSLPQFVQASRVRVTNEIYDLSLVQPHRNVKKFDGDRLTLTDLSVKYLIHKFPNIDSMGINRYSYARCDNEEGPEQDTGDEVVEDRQTRDYGSEGVAMQRFDLTADAQVAFFKYLSKIQFYRVFGVFSEHIYSMMKTFMDVTSDSNHLIKVTYETLIETKGTDITPLKICKPSYYNWASGKNMVTSMEDSNSHVIELNYRLNFDRDELPHDD